jgi:uncharacterized protein YndB with AHSA1/START domain
MESVDREIFLDAPPSDVWEAVSDPRELSEWFGTDVSGDVQAGEILRTSDERRAIVEQVEAPHRLVFRWLGDEPSRVEIAITEHDGGSVVRVTEQRIESAVDVSPTFGFRALART